MIAVHIMCGMGNQLFQYACARQVAYRNNAELKLDILGISKSERENPSHHSYYQLGNFNIIENFATADELKTLKRITEPNFNRFVPALLEKMDNVLLHGYWQLNGCYFAEIEEILRRELTPKNPFGRTAELWKNKILAAECAVSLHIRHGDYLSPLARNHFGLLPMRYYTDCLARLKKDFPNLTVFVFSDDIGWAKNNFRLGVPTEFVDGCEKDVEELFLMSYCRHNITANSTFSWWGAWLNRTPDKKVFVPLDVKKFPPEQLQNRYLPKGFIDVPVDFDQKGHIEFPPVLSLILYVENDAETIRYTLGSILAQKVRPQNYELIVLDASDDGSGKLCRAVTNFENISVLKVSSANKFQAFNRGVEIARGEYVWFLDGKTYIMPNCFKAILSVIYQIITELEKVFAGKLQEYWNYKKSDAYPNIICATLQFNEDTNGNYSVHEIEGRRFSLTADEPFKNLQRVAPVKIPDAVKCQMLADKAVNNLLCTKIFKREFLKKFGVHFNEFAEDKATLQFLINAFLCADEIIFYPNAFCGRFAPPPPLA